MSSKLLMTLKLSIISITYCYKEHQWCKHGTCGSNEPSLDSELKYFNVSLVLSRAYNIENILAMNDIVPDSSVGYEVS